MLIVHRAPGGEEAMQNDDWNIGDDPAGIAAVTTAAGVFDLPPGSRAAALILTVGPSVAGVEDRGFTLEIRGGDGGTGIGSWRSPRSPLSSAMRRLFGLGTVGGTLSTYTKVPRLDRSFFSPGITVDDSGGVRGEVDYNVAAGERIAFRVNALLDHTRGWQDGDEGEKQALTVAGLFTLSDRT